jgi:hypothetical protein
VRALPSFERLEPARVASATDEDRVHSLTIATLALDRSWQR